MLFIFNKVGHWASIRLTTQMTQYEVCRVRHADPLMVKYVERNIVLPSNFFRLISLTSTRVIEDSV